MASSNNRKKRIMTIQEVSAYLKIPASTLYGLTKKGKIRGIKIGKHWRFLEEDIHAFLHGLCQNSNLNHEHRPHTRINSELPAELTVLLMRRGELRRDGALHDLSLGGARFTSKENGIYLSPGDPVRLVIGISNLECPRLELEGRIIYQSQGPAFTVGIKFRNISASDRRVIEDYVG